jgi:Na+/melibiose symporter-like transporter
VTVVRSGAIPAAAMLAAAGVMLAYPLGEQALRRMVGELAERRALGTEIATTA